VDKRSLLFALPIWIAKIGTQLIQSSEFVRSPKLAARARTCISLIWMSEPGLLDPRFFPRLKGTKMPRFSGSVETADSGKVDGNSFQPNSQAKKHPRSKNGRAGGSNPPARLLLPSVMPCAGSGDAVRPLGTMHHQGIMAARRWSRRWEVFSYVRNDGTFLSPIRHLGSSLQLRVSHSPITGRTVPTVPKRARVNNLGTGSSDLVSGTRDHADHDKPKEGGSPCRPRLLRGFVVWGSF
jgi:hypothetical protein